MMATMQINQLINNGKGMFYDHGGEIINILPQNVPAKSIETVDHYHNIEERADYISLKFKNGHVSLLRLWADTGIADDDLKEFQARCIMIHDI